MTKLQPYINPLGKHPKKLIGQRVQFIGEGIIGNPVFSEEALKRIESLNAGLSTIKE